MKSDLPTLKSEIELGVIPFAKHNLVDKVLTFCYKDITIDNDQLYDDGKYFFFDFCLCYQLEEEYYWKQKILDIDKVIIDSSFYDYAPKSFAFLFYNLQNVTAYEGLEYLNFTNIEDVHSMFSENQSITSLDLSSFNTSKVKNMSYMFENCEKLQELNLSNFSTKSLIWENKPFEEYDNGIAAMFKGCQNLKTIYANQEWQTNEAIIASGWVFKDCVSLIGGQGSKPLNPEYDGIYARIDGGQEKPGYFTLKEE